jgi:hypothetical protein
VTGSASRSAETTNGRGGSRAANSTESTAGNVLLPLPGVDATTGRGSLLPLPSAGSEVS